MLLSHEMSVYKFLSSFRYGKTLQILPVLFQNGIIDML